MNHIFISIHFPLPCSLLIVSDFSMFYLAAEYIDSWRDCSAYFLFFFFMHLYVMSKSARAISFMHVGDLTIFLLTLVSLIRSLCSQNHSLICFSFSQRQMKSNLQENQPLKDLLLNWIIWQNPLFLRTSVSLKKSKWQIVFNRKMSYF